MTSAPVATVVVLRSQIVPFSAAGKPLAHKARNMPNDGSGAQPGLPPVATFGGELAASGQIATGRPRANPAGRQHWALGSSLVGMMRPSPTGQSEVNPTSIVPLACTSVLPADEEVN